MSCWRCTQPFGLPVVPDEYSQNAGASRLVGSASSTGDESATSFSRRIARPSSMSSPATTTWRMDEQAADGFVRFSVQRSAQDDDARRRVAEDVVVFRRGPSRVQGHRDGADLDGTEEGGNHLRQIEHQQQDTFFRPDAELVPEGVPRPVDLLLKFAIRQPAAVALDCNRFRSSFVDMAVDEVGSGVENRSGGARRAHGSRLYAPRSIRTGSTPAARHAGIRQASAPTARSSNGTPMNVNASWGATP